MAYKVLYRKYRPQDFNNLYGQENIKKLLIESIKSKKLSHAYLFSGPRGTGKTSTAKLFAKTINCENPIDGIPCNNCPSCTNYEESPDIIEIDAASNNGVDEIRDLRDNAKILPTFSKYKVYIIDEVHMLSQSAWNAFLKILEEPPKHIVFILATTEIQKVPITILSRCQRFNFKKISPNTIAENIKRISQLEEIKIEDEAIQYLAELSDGGMRDALSFLDQLSKENALINNELIEKTFGIIGINDIDKMFEALFQKKFADFNNIIDEYKQKGLDINILINKIIDYLYNMQISIANGKFSSISSEQIKLLSKELSECYNKKNAFNLIKIILISYFTDSNNTQEIISREIISENTSQFKTEEPEEKKIKTLPKNSNNPSEISSKNDQIISREIILPPSNIEITEEIIEIRINNAYVGANKELKTNFKKQWEKFISDITLNKKSEILSIIEDTTIEVVSPTNVIFSHKSPSTAVLFNNSVNYIEQEFQKNAINKLNFICLEQSRWLQEKENYIKNKNKKYEYIPENTKEKQKKAVFNAASELFENINIEER